MRRCRVSAPVLRCAAVALSAALVAAAAGAGEPAALPPRVNLAAGDELGWQLFGADHSAPEAGSAGLEDASAARQDPQRHRDELIRWLYENGEREARAHQQQPR